MGQDALTFPNTAVDGETTDGCAVSKNYQQITFAACSQTEPDATDSFHMAPDAATDATKITVNQAGHYRLELTALLTTTRFPMRVEVFKQSTKDPDAACGTVASACSPLLQLKGQGKEDSNTYVGIRSTSGAAVWQLCPGDELVVVASKAGSLITNVGTVAGGTQGVRTIFTITKVWHP
jgi:hypothetical protein